LANLLLAYVSEFLLLLSHSGPGHTHAQADLRSVADTGKRDIIPKSMQLVAGRTGQEYNQRKNRRGAYWEDRYHATAVESGDHLARCLVYIDTNMVRAGVVSHPSKWPFSGYNEIQEPRRKNVLKDWAKPCRFSRTVFYR
jgi:hypothetical protein